MRKKLAIVLLFVSVFLIIGGVVVMNYTPYVFKTALINYKNTLFSNEQAERLFPMEVMKVSILKWKWYFKWWYYQKGECI